MKAILRALTACLIMLCSTTYADTNFRVDAIGALANVLSVDIDMPFSNAWTLGPTFRYAHRNNTNWNAHAYMIGARANYWFNQKALSQGWYAGPSISYIEADAKFKPDSETVRGRGVSFAAVGGYQWVWNSFNMNLGAGPVYYSLDNISVTNRNGQTEKYGYYSGAGITGEFTLGWRF